MLLMKHGPDKSRELASDLDLWHECSGGKVKGTMFGTKFIVGSPFCGDLYAFNTIYLQVWHSQLNDHDWGLVLNLLISLFSHIHFCLLIAWFFLRLNYFLSEFWVDDFTTTYLQFNKHYCLKCTDFQIVMSCRLTACFIA